MNNYDDEDDLNADFGYNQARKSIIKPFLKGRFIKRSGWGMSQNERLLVVTPTHVQYYSSVPEDFDPYSMTFQDENLKKPKQMLKIQYIHELTEPNEKECQKEKKAFDSNKDSFKIGFDPEGLKLDYKNDEKKSFDKKKLEWWWFSSDVKDPKGPKLNEWVKTIAYYVEKAAGEKPIISKKMQELIDSVEDVWGDEDNILFEEKQLIKPQPVQSNKKQNIEETKQAINTQQKYAGKSQDIIVPKINENPYQVPEKSKPKKDQQKSKPAQQDDIIYQNLSIRPTGIETAQDKQKQGSNQETKTVELTPEKIGQYNSKVTKYFQKAELQQKQNSEKEELGWDLKFQNYWGHIVRSNQSNQKNSLLISEYFIKHIGDFRKTCQEVVESIVNELSLADSERKFKRNMKPEMESFLEEKPIDKATETMMFYDKIKTKNIIIKMTTAGSKYIEQNQDAKNQELSHGRSAIQNSSIYMNSIERLWWKKFGQEFLSYDITFDALYFNSKPDNSFKLRTPLVAKVDYKGFRAICTAYIKIEYDLQPTVGYYVGDKYSCDDESLQDLRKVGEVLNMKDNKIQKKGFSQQFENIPLSSYIQVYICSAQEEDKKNKQIDSPTSSSWSTIHYDELIYYQKPKYLINVVNLFPYDFEVNDRIPNTTNILRPEFVVNYERPLKSDTKKPPPYQNAFNNTERSTDLDKTTKSRGKDQAVNDEDQADVMELNEASRVLRKNQINELVELLDSLHVVPIDSQSLEQVFHIKGVNMRYLGVVALESVCSHIKDICVTDMIARTLKRILNQQISELILENQKNLDMNKIRLQNKKEELMRLMSGESTVFLPSNNNSKINIEKSKEELLAITTDLEIEIREQEADMETNVRHWTHDFMNLVFGTGDENKPFFHEIVFPEVVTHYQPYPLEELVKYDMRLNALFFAMLELIGLKCVPFESKANELVSKINTQRVVSKPNQQASNDSTAREESFYKNFGRQGVENPFGDPNSDKDKAYEFQYIAKSKTYQLRNLLYTQKANQFQEFKENDMIEQALESCRMRHLLKMFLVGNNEAETTTNADLCQIYLEKQQYDLAIQASKRALQIIHPLHASAIKFYCIQMQAYYLADQIADADVLFTKALSILDHHWGPFHPLHINVYSIMAQLLIQKKKLDDAKYLYQASLLCCLRLLGPNHIQTGEVHMDFGKLFLLKEEKQESLQHFIEAFLIYRTTFDEDTLQTGEAALYIANLLEEQKRFEEAFKYVEIAARNYEYAYETGNPKTIKVLWQKISISYALEKPETEAQCDQLLKLLAERDNPDKRLPKDPVVEDIKIYVMATVIMQITRKEPPDQRRYIKSFCDKLLFNKLQQAANRGGQQSLDTIPQLTDVHYRHIDATRIASVRKLNFPIKGREKLLQWYDQSAKDYLEKSNYNKDESIYFIKHYRTKLIDICEKEGMLSKKKDENDAKRKEPKDRPAEEPEISRQIFPTVTDEDQNSEETAFFDSIIQTFEEINFYNLLMHD